MPATLGSTPPPPHPYSEIIQMPGINPRHPPRMSTLPTSPALTPALPELEKFRDNLLRGMMNKNMSASDVARAVWGSKTNNRGASVARNRDRMTHYLAGKAYPRPETVLTLAEVLDLDPSDLEREMYKLTGSPGDAARVPPPQPAPSEPKAFTFDVRGPRRVFLSFNMELDLDIAMKVFDAIRGIVPAFTSEEEPKD